MDCPWITFRVTLVALAVNPAAAVESMANLYVPDTPPLGAELSTATSAVPTVAISAALMAACNCVELTQVVVRFEPFHCTVATVPNSTSITLTGGTINVSGGESGVSCFISVSVKATATGALNNTTGPISANEGGTGATSNTASLTVTPALTVLPPTITQAFATNPGIGGTTALTFTITNPNASTTLFGIDLNDTLSGGLVVASPNGVGGTCITNGALVLATAGTNSLRLGLMLPASGSCSFSVNVSVANSGTQASNGSAVTATYDDGSGNLVGVTGATSSASFNVAPSVVTVNVTDSSFTVSAGQSGLIQLTIGSTGVLIAPITFGCSGLPTGVSCSFSPPSVGPTGLPATVKLTITTTPLSAAVRNGLWHAGWMLALVLPGIVLLPAMRRRAPKHWRWLGLTLLILLALMLCVSCGGSSTPPANPQGTTPGTYPMTVTASSSGSLAGTWNLTLTVTP